MKPSRTASHHVDIDSHKIRQNRVSPQPGATARARPLMNMRMLPRHHNGYVEQAWPTVARHVELDNALALFRPLSLDRVCGRNPGVPKAWHEAQETMHLSGLTGSLLVDHRHTNHAPGPGWKLGT